MPDVTSTLLAMYQQIIGGSSAREQSSLEAECARRIITSGLTIAGSGAFTMPGNVTIGGTLSVVNFSVTGTFSVPGTLTVGTLAVTGNATVAGTLTVPTLVGPTTVTGGLLTASGGLTTTTLSCTGAATVGGTLGVTGLLSASAGLGVSGSVSITVNNPGAALVLALQNVAAVGAAITRLHVGNDTDPALLALLSFASTYSASGYTQPNGSAIYQGGPGGLSMLAAHAAGSIRLYTGGTTERVRLTATGALWVNTAAILWVGAGQLEVASAGGPTMVLAISGGVSGNLVVFANNTQGTAGFINQINASTVQYATTSDARLKIDLGRATDLTALRAVVVHDFRWRVDGLSARGVFAQDAHRVFPQAVAVGTDERTAQGELAHPWGTDYSKFVPDLIVGWQQHEDRCDDLQAQITALTARLRDAA